jgi:hypothetical protein
LYLSDLANRSRSVDAGLAAGFEELSMPHISVLQFPGPERVRPSTLAERAGMSKQAPSISPRIGLDGVADALTFAQHAIEMFRRSLPDGPPRRCLDRLSNRLTKILSEARKLNQPG